MAKIYDNLKEYPPKAGEKSFKEAIQRVKDTCGLTHDMADTIVRIFTRELADCLVNNAIVEIPHIGTLYYYNKIHGTALSLRVSPEYKAIKNKGGTDENNFIRAVEKSSIGSSGRDEDGIISRKR